jgi:hypothetical protein
VQLRPKRHLEEGELILGNDRFWRRRRETNFPQLPKSLNISLPQLSLFGRTSPAEPTVILNIGLKLALGQAVAYFVQWTIVGMVIGLIYKPLATP